MALGFPEAWRCQPLRWFMSSSTRRLQMPLHQTCMTTESAKAPMRALWHEDNAPLPVQLLASNRLLLQYSLHSTLSYE